VNDFRKLINLVEDAEADAKKLRDTFGWNDDQAKAAVDAAAEVAPEVDSNAPAKPVAPTTDTAPAQPAGNNPDEAPATTATPAKPVAPAADTAPEQPAGNNPDEADATTAAPTQPAGNNPDEAPATTAEPDTNTSGSPTPMSAQGGRPAAPAQPGQQTSGLPAKLGQIKSANLMKDYNTGGKKPMAQVKDVQTALSRLGHDPNGLDGKYGPGTFKAVQEFQKANGLTVDGQVGPNTIKKMIEKLGGAAAPAADPGVGAEVPAAQQPAAQSGAGDEAAAQAAVQQATATDEARITQLLDKLAAPEQQNASIDFRHLIAITEGKLLEAKLEPAEVEELKSLITKHKGNPNFNKELLSRAEAAVAASGPQTGSGAPTPSTSPKPLDQAKTPNNKVEPVSAAPTTGSGNPTPANADAGKPAQPDFAKQARDQEALNKKVQADADAKALGAFGGSQDPTAMRDIKVPAQPKPEPEQKVWRDGSGNVIKSGDGTPVRARSDNQIWWDQNMQGKPFPGDAQAQKAIDARKAQGDKNWNSIRNLLGGNKPKQNASKDFSMKNNLTENTNLDECGPMPSMPQQQGTPVSMNVTLNASGEQHVQELLRMMQLAGAKQAAPVADMHVGPSNDHDDMIHMMQLASEEAVEDTSEYDEVVAEWDNTPEEEYKDHNYMTQDLSGGINRSKKAYAKAQDGDNAMAVEAIKSDLRKALEEALAKKN